jgi:hypothetical protein
MNFIPAVSASVPYVVILACPESFLRSRTSQKDSLQAGMTIKEYSISDARSQGSSHMTFNSFFVKLIKLFLLI